MSKLFLLQITPASRLGTPSNEKHFGGTKFGLPRVLALPRTGKNIWGIKFGLRLPSPIPGLRLSRRWPLRQRLDPPVTDDQNSVLDGLKVRTLEEILQLKRNEDW